MLSPVTPSVSSVRACSYAFPDHESQIRRTNPDRRLYKDPSRVGADSVQQRSDRTVRQNRGAGDTDGVRGVNSYSYRWQDEVLDMVGDAAGLERSTHGKSGHCNRHRRFDGSQCAWMRTLSTSDSGGFSERLRAHRVVRRAGLGGRHLLRTLDGLGKNISCTSPNRFWQESIESRSRFQRRSRGCCIRGSECCTGEHRSSAFEYYGAHIRAPCISVG